MLMRFHQWLIRTLGVKVVPSVARATDVTEAVEITDHHDLVPYDENLLERTRTQWQFGDWLSLTKLTRQSLQHHPDRAKLALLAAAGRLQTGQAAEAKAFICLAQDWGVSRNLIGQILIAGVYNSIGRAAIINNEENRAIKHFKSSIKIATPRDDIDLLIKARHKEQKDQINLPVLSGALFAGLDYCVGFTPVLLHEGYEARVYRVGAYVIKYYKEAYYKYNKEFRRKGEADFLKKYKSDFFVSIIQDTPFYIVMPYEGKSIGTLNELDYNISDSGQLGEWLRNLMIELKSLNINHRDINPSNILYNEKGGYFKLIDFSWAIGPEDEKNKCLKPQGMNPYGPEDLQAISKMLDAIQSRNL